MSELEAKIEAILFLSTRPVSFKKLASILKAKDSEVRIALESLSRIRNTDLSGIHVITANGAVELASNPNFADVLAAFSKEEVESELTRPQLETLTIIAYRGPITKPEIEHIRGVNCSLILRNLLMRGLIMEKEDPVRIQSIYTLSSEMLRHLGVHDVKELPDFDEFSSNKKIDQMLEAIFVVDEPSES